MRSRRERARKGLLCLFQLLKVHSEGRSSFVREVVRAVSRPETCAIYLCEPLLRLGLLPTLPLRDARWIARVLSAQGDRIILIIPSHGSQTRSTAASAAGLEPGTRAHASGLQRLAACSTAQA